jgi:hypothetical protein
MVADVALPPGAKSSKRITSRRVNKPDIIGAAGSGEHYSERTSVPVSASYERRMRFYPITALVLLLAAGARGQTAKVEPPALAARDAHQNLLVVADPYISAERYKGMFGKKSPYDSGIVAIDVYFRNDNDAPIRLDLDTIRLVVASPDEERQRLAPLSAEEVADRVLLKAEANPSVPRRTLPFPGSGMKMGKGKDWDKMVVLLRSVALDSNILPPHATIHGLLFFDMNYQFDAIRHSRVYIPDLSFMTDNRALLFFEIDLGSPRAN